MTSFPLRAPAPGRRDARREARRAYVAAALALSLPLLPFATACGAGEDSPGAGDPIPREVFIAAYVDLRLAALEDTTTALPPERRERILATHGVTGDDLLRFVEAHGTRPDFIRDVWNEVAEKLETALEPGETDA